MILAHLHPILVHFTLTLGVVWCLADLIFLRISNKIQGAPAWRNPRRALEGIVILFMVTIATGWISLAFKEQQGGPGSVFAPGREHGDLALLALGLLLLRSVLAARQDGQTVPETQKGWGMVLSLLALISILMTAILGERLVFYDGVTRNRTDQPPSVSLLSHGRGLRSDRPDLQDRPTSARIPGRFQSRPSLFHSFPDGSWRPDAQSGFPDPPD